MNHARGPMELPSWLWSGTPLPLGNNPGSGVPDHNQDGSSIGPRAWFTLAYRF